MSRIKVPRRLADIWREWVKPLTVALLVVSSIRSTLADWNDVPTGSMKPTILEGDRIVVNKLAYDLKVPFTTWHLKTWSHPQRGDIVVFFSPADGKRLVKRVVGLPGDRVELRDEQLWVNSEPIQYQQFSDEYLNPDDPDYKLRHQFAVEQLGEKLHPVMILPQVPARRTFGTITVPADHYFMMGDNRDNSFDSRYFGCVARSQMIGRAVAIAASVNPQQYYLPRWQRFFSPLN